MFEGKFLYLHTSCKSLYYLIFCFLRLFSIQTFAQPSLLASKASNTIGQPEEGNYRLVLNIQRVKVYRAAQRLGWRPVRLMETEDYCRMGSPPGRATAQTFTREPGKNSRNIKPYTGRVNLGNKWMDKSSNFSKIGF